MYCTLPSLYSTVKPPKRGHFGTVAFVFSSEVAPFFTSKPYSVCVKCILVILWDFMLQDA